MAPTTSCLWCMPFWRASPVKHMDQRDAGVPGWCPASSFLAVSLFAYHQNPNCVLGLEGPVLLWTRLTLGPGTILIGPSQSCHVTPLVDDGCRFSKGMESWSTAMEGRNLLGNIREIVSCSYKGVEMLSSVWYDGNHSNNRWTMREAGLKGQTKPPGSLDHKESACTAGDMGLIPGLGRSPGEGNSNPLQCPCLENSMDRGTRQATVHGGCKESETTERLTRFQANGGNRDRSGGKLSPRWFCWAADVISPGTGPSRGFFLKGNEWP